MVLVAVFVALITAGAFITIPFPVVPLTMQIVATTLAGLLLGPLYGGLAIALYVFIGLIGIPVFAKGGGFTYVLQPSFGYVLGMLVGAVVSGLIVQYGKKRSYWVYVLASIVNMLIIYLVGVPYYYLISTFYIGNSVTAKFLFVNMFLMLALPDVLKCSLTALLAKKLSNILKLEQVSIVTNADGMAGFDDNELTAETVKSVEENDSIADDIFVDNIEE